MLLLAVKNAILISTDYIQFLGRAIFVNSIFIVVFTMLKSENSGDSVKQDFKRLSHFMNGKYPTQLCPEVQSDMK